MARHLLPVDLGFLASAPHRAEREAHIAAAPAAVFDALAKDPAGWGEWFPGFSTAGRYTTPGPPGVGSEREMRLAGMRVVETVLAWEEPGRFAFRVSTVTAPFVTAMAEDYRITPRDGASVLTWTVAVDGSGPVAVAGRGLGAVMGSLLPRAARNLERHLHAAAGKG